MTCVSEHSPSVRKAPNILVIMPDQMRGDCLSLAGHPVLQTPAMDSIGREGTHFTAGFSTCASCVPARRGLLTGLHPATTGMVGMSAGYPISEITLPAQLSDHGYRTALVGREMHQSPYDEPYGFQTRILGSTHRDHDEYATALMAAVPGLKSLRDLGVTFNGWGAKAWEYAESMHPTTWVARRTREFLAAQSDDQPLFLTSSYYAPHPPLLPPKRYFDAFLNQALPEPSYGDWNDPSPGNADQVTMDSHRVHLEGEALRRAQAGYFGLIAQLDAQIAPIIQDFKDKSEAAGRPWVIALISDHGEMLGDHHYYRKCEPYEGASRIPFLIQGSEAMGWCRSQINGSPVCLEDIMPTVLDAAGIPVPEGLDGHSLVPLLKGTQSRVRPFLHGEHAPQYSDEQAYHFLTDGEFKYLWRPFGGREQLFDRVRDPGERHDLANDPAWQATLERWRGRLIRHLENRPEGFSDGRRLIPDQDYPRVLPFLEKQRLPDA